MTPNHLALALLRPGAGAEKLLGESGVDPLAWRDHINTVLGWQEGGLAEREGRPAGRVADSPAELRFDGDLDLDLAAAHVLDLAAAEASDNAASVGPAHLLVALLRETDSVAAATGRWRGLTPGRIRSLAGLRNERRVVAAGVPPKPSPRGLGCGPLVLCGGVADDDLRRAVIEVAGPSPRTILVDAGWATRPPTDDTSQRHVDRWVAAGADVVAPVVVDRDAACSPAVVSSLAGARLVWFGGGDACAIFDRLWGTPALDAIRTAHEGGAVVGGVSAGARVLGAGMQSDYASLGHQEPFPLFGWLDDVIVFTHYLPSRERSFRDELRGFPVSRGLAVAHGGAVVIRTGDDPIDVLRPGVGGVAHYLLDDADGPLSAIGSHP